MAELSIIGVHKSYGRVQALSGVDLGVRSGALVAVLGPSGSGKTTLLRCIAGFEAPDAGEIRIDGRPVATPDASVPPERRRIAVVPQEGALFPHLSVLGNVAYGLGRASRRAGRAAAVLDLVGLAGFEDRMPHHLSGGQQQRVAVARALAPRPPIVLLDEPFNALDAALRADLRRDVWQALRADGATAVLVTHDQAEALSMAEEIGVMRDGRIVQTGPPELLYRAPADPWVAGFVGEAVWLPGVSSSHPAGHDRTHTARRRSADRSDARAATARADHARLAGYQGCDHRDRGAARLLRPRRDARPAPGRRHTGGRTHLRPGSPPARRR
jgi:iron(III) transport system ATP-binding protein